MGVNISFCFRWVGLLGREEFGINVSLLISSIRNDSIFS